MRTLRSAWALLALPLAAAIGPIRRDRGPLFTNSEVVRTLTDDTFDAALNDSQTVWLVDFYSPWCPHCRQFGPQWEQVANVYAASSNVQLGAVDCTREKRVCDQEDIHSYPAVQVYHAGEETIRMPHKRHIYAPQVARWIAEVLQEHGIQSGVDIDQVYPPKQLRDEGKKETFEFAEPVEPTHDDTEDGLKLKRLRDAGATALFAFEDGFFMGTKVLEGERYDAALTWVDALAASFPVQANRAAFATLADVLRQQQRWERTEWMETLRKWQATANTVSFPPDLFASSDHLAFCTTYTCGLWTLFHSLIVSDVKTVSPREPWKPSEIMAAIRLFVRYFFGCEECKQHFLKANHDNVLKKLAARDDEGPQAVAFWIWKMHNTVNKVLKRAMWPTQKSCPTCYVDNGKALSLDPAQLNEKEIVAYIASVYKLDGTSSMSGGVLAALWSTSGFSIIAVVALVGVVLAKHFKKQPARFVNFKARDHIA